MRFPLLSRLFLYFVLTLIARADWIQTRQVNDVAYFLRNTPTRVDRYDLTNRQWLSSITLPAARGAATAGYFDANGMYVAYSRAVYRYDLNGANEVSVLNTATNVVGIVANATHYFVHHPGTISMTSVSKATNAVVESKEFWYSMIGMSIAPDGSAIFARSSSVSPSDIVKIPVNANGTMGAQTDSPHHGDYPTGNQTWVFPNSGRVVDSTGTVYSTGNLQFTISFGSSITDLQFRGADVPIVLRGAEVVAFTNTLLPTGSATLTLAGKSLYLQGNDALVFSPDAAQPNGARVTAVPFSTLSAPTPNQPLSAEGLAYTPDNVFLDKDGIVHLFSKAHESIFRWDPAQQKYISTIPLLGAPVFVAYSADTHTIYTAYSTGLIRSMNLNAATVAEAPFANVPTAPPLGLATAGQYVFVCDGSGAWVSHHTYSPAGALIESVDWNYFSTEYIWSSANQKMYFFRDDTSPNDILWEEINASGSAYAGVPAGAMGNKFDSPLHTSDGFSHPIRISPDGTTIVLGSGVLHHGQTLARLPNSLSNSVSDVAWIGSNLKTIRSVTGAAQFQQWSGANYAQGLPLQVPGTAHRLITLSADRLVGITLVNGVPSFYILDPAFSVIAPSSLAAPTNLAAAVTATNQITVTWADVAGESSYVVERRTLPGTTWQTVANTGVSVVSAVDAGMTLGNVYAYRVTAKNGALASAPSTEVQVNFSTPPAPQGLVASAISSSAINVQWTDSPTETSYVLERKTGVNGSWSQLATPTANQTTYADQYLSAGTQYYYRLRAVNALGASPNSAEASATTSPLAPTTPSFNTWSAANYFTINLSWSNSSYEDNFVLERLDPLGVWTVIASPGQNVTSYVDTTVQALKTYSYRIKAVNTIGASNYSSTVSVTTPGITPPAAPTVLNAQPLNGTTVAISWTGVTQADGYTLQRRDDNVTNWVTIATKGANETTHVNTGLVTGVQYFYRVAAFNAGGPSSYSNIDDAVPLDYAAVYVDDFDPSLAGIWSSVTSGSPVNGGAGFRGSNALHFGAFGNREAVLLPIDTRLGGFVEFFFRAGNQAVDGVQYWDDCEAGEGVALEYSLNGTAWTSLLQIDTTAAPAKSWRSYSVEIPSAARAANVQFRWRQAANSGAAFDVWALDDVAVRVIAPPLPLPPGGLIVSANSSSRLTAMWSPVVGATSYIVEMQDAGGWKTVATVAGTTQWFTIGGLTENTLYAMRVRSANFSGVSDSSFYALARTWRALDDPTAEPVLSLSASTYAASETASGGVALIVVERSLGITGSASVDYHCTNGSAIGGVDFEAVSGTLVFAPGEVSKTIAVPILPDSIDEPAETFMVSLSSPDSGLNLGTVSATVTISDDDETGVIAFQTSGSSVREGEVAQIVLRRTGGTVGVVSVTAMAEASEEMIAGGTGGDSWTATFADGEDTALLQIPTEEDASTERTQHIRIVLANATGGAAIKSQTHHVLTIRDNEPFQRVPNTYLGLIENPANGAGRGWIRFTGNAAGRVTGKVCAGGEIRSFKGTLDDNGQLVAPLIPLILKLGSSFEQSITLSLNSVADECSIKISDPKGLELIGWAEALKKGSSNEPVPGAGTFTAVCGNDDAGNGLGKVTGFLRVRVAPTGAVIAQGTAPDGKPIRFSSAVTSSQRLPLAFVPYGEPDHGIFGWVDVAQDSSRITGTVQWKKPAATRGAFAQPVDTSLDVDGRAYAAPASSSLRASVGASQGPAQLTLTGGVFPQPVTAPAFVNQSGRAALTLAGQGRITITTNWKTGLITGNGLDPYGVRLQLRGILLRSCEGEHSVGKGLFQDRSATGVFEIGTFPGM